MVQKLLRKWRRWRLTPAGGISGRIRDGSLVIGSGVAWSPNRFELPEGGRIEVGCDTVLRGRLVCRRAGAEITVGDRVFVGPGTILLSAERLRVGHDVLIGSECYLTDNDGHSLDFDVRKHDLVASGRGEKDWTDIATAPTTIGSGCWLGPRCILLKGVTIGERTVVGAGSVITSDLPADVLAAGNPARVIRALGDGDHPTQAS